MKFIPENIFPSTAFAYFEKAAKQIGHLKTCTPEDESFTLKHVVFRHHSTTTNVGTV